MPHANNLIIRLVTCLLLCSLLSSLFTAQPSAAQPTTILHTEQALAVRTATVSFAGPEDTIQLLGSYQERSDFGRYTSDVEVAGNVAYLVDPFYVTPSQNEGLRIFDISNPLSPTLRSELGFSGGATSLELHGKLAYIIAGGELKIVDVSNPLSPTLLTHYKPADFHQIQIVDDRAYVLGYPELQILDLTTPLSPTLLGTINRSRNDTSKLEVIGNRIYIVSSEGTLEVFDSSNPRNPIQLTTYGSAIRDVRVIGNLAYLAVGHEMQVLDISDLNAPRILSRYPIRGDATRLELDDKLAYVASYHCLTSIRPGCTLWEGTLQVIDISQPLYPFLRGRYTTPPSNAPTSLLTASGLIFESGKTLRLRRLIPATTASISNDGVLTSEIDSTSYVFPTGSFSQPVTVTHIRRFHEDLPSTGNLFSIDHTFQTSAVFTSSNEPATPMLPYTLTVQYTASEQSVAIEATLALYHWDGSQWIKEPSSRLDVQTRTISAITNQLGLWAVLGETRRTLLPLLLANKT